MQHFRVKIFAEAADGLDIGAAIPVFHRWIQKSTLNELLIDVADYQHVPAGPGIVLIGHDSIYGLDQTKNRLGLLYTRRTALDGTTAERAKQALDAATAACAALEAEPEFAGKLRFRRDEIEVSVNDRALAPNTAEQYAALAAELQPLLGGYALTHVGEPRELLTASARRN